MQREARSCVEPLAAAGRRSPLPLVCKDLIVDPLQIAIAVAEEMAYQAAQEQLPRQAAAWVEPAARAEPQAQFVAAPLSARRAMTALQPLVEEEFESPRHGIDVADPPAAVDPPASTRALASSR